MPSAHVGGLYERQHIERDLSPLVAERHGVESARVDGRHIHALRRHESAAESDALGRIVVAADDENAAQRRERDEKVVEKLDGLGARHRLVVDVAGNDRGVRPLRPHYAEHGREYVFLVFEHGELADAFAEVKIGQMYEFHTRPLENFMQYLLIRLCCGRLLCYHVTIGPQQRF